MSMKIIFSDILLKVVLIFLLFASAVACSQSALGPIGFGDSQSGDHSSSGSGQNITENPYALLSAEQVLKSFSSITGTPISNTIQSEYNTRGTILSEGYDLKLVTAPMLIAVANLGSQFCLDTISREVGLSAANRKFFSSINFSRGPFEITQEQLEQSIKSMSLHFWSREPRDYELQVIKEGVSEFLSLIEEDQRNSNTQTRNTLLFTCTAMISAFDTLTL